MVGGVTILNKRLFDQPHILDVHNT
jgi:hypothetical protein